MTDVNSLQYPSASSHMAEDGNSSFILNQSNVPMDIDDGIDDEQHQPHTLISNGPTKVNGHLSPTSQSIENELDSVDQKQEDFYPKG